MSDELLIDYVRSIGLACNGIAAPNSGSRHCGWTTDKAKADLARDAGAVVTTYTTRNPIANGWEISFPQGATRVKR